MAKYELKTKITDADVKAYVAAVENDTRRADAEQLLDIYADITGMNPKMWGPSIIGYGSYHYKYDSGQEGDMCRLGFSPRKANLVLYLKGSYPDADKQQASDRLHAALGKYKRKGGCLYLNKLADVDIRVLKEMIALDLEWMDQKYPR